MPGPLEPMLATLAEHPPLGAEWLYEVKWDGVRAMAFVNNGKVLLRPLKTTASAAVIRLPATPGLTAAR